MLKKRFLRMKKDKVTIEFKTPEEQEQFLKWAVQPSESSPELERVKDIQKKVKENREKER